MQKEEQLQHINNLLEALLNGERDWLINLANSSALLYNELEGINWAGFYLLRQQQLVLGPFQGRPACVRIEPGKGVCGSAARDRRTYLVPDVHKFPGHIACDERSRSEIVIPLELENKLVGVLDIDSPYRERFDRLDQQYLEEFVQILLRKTDFKSFLRYLY